MPVVLSRQLLDQESGKCVVHLSWNVPPTNNISHFAININGTHIANETTKLNDSSIVKVFPVCSCGSHNITISTINKCGKTGSQSTYNIILGDRIPQPQPMICSRSTPAAEMISDRDDQGST